MQSEHLDIRMPSIQCRISEKENYDESRFEESASCSSLVKFRLSAHEKE